LRRHQHVALDGDGRAADKETARPSKLPLSWFDFDALYDGDAHN
jgi:hypothetical protein